MRMVLQAGVVLVAALAAANAQGFTPPGEPP
jgi:hypothetical protein